MTAVVSRHFALLSTRDAGSVISQCTTARGDDLNTRRANLQDAGHGTVCCPFLRSSCALLVTVTKVCTVVAARLLDSRLCLAELTRVW